MAASVVGGDEPDDVDEMLEQLQFDMGAVDPADGGADSLPRNRGCVSSTGDDDGDADTAREDSPWPASQSQSPLTRRRLRTAAVPIPIAGSGSSRSSSGSELSLSRTASPSSPIAMVSAGVSAAAAVVSGADAYATSPPVTFSPVIASLSVGSVTGARPGTPPIGSRVGSWQQRKQAAAAAAAASGHVLPSSSPLVPSPLNPAPHSLSYTPRSPPSSALFATLIGSADRRGSTESAADADDASPSPQQRRVSDSAQSPVSPPVFSGSVIGPRRAGSTGSNASSSSSHHHVAGRRRGSSIDLPQPAISVGSFDELLLANQTSHEPSVRFGGYSASLFVPGRPKLTLAFKAVYHSLGPDTPYTAALDLPPEGYAIPAASTIHITLCNPKGTPIKLLSLRYNLKGMPPHSKTFLRQKICVASASSSSGSASGSSLASTRHRAEDADGNGATAPGGSGNRGNGDAIGAAPSSPLSSSSCEEPSSRASLRLRYAAQVSFVSMDKKQYALSGRVRIVFPARQPDPSESLVTTYDGPTAPRYYPIR